MTEVTNRKPMLDEAADKLDEALHGMKFAIDVERESAAGVMREIAWVLWGNEALTWKLPTSEIYAKFKDEVYNKGIHGLLKRTEE